LIIYKLIAMKTESSRKTAAAKGQPKIETDLPLSEKDEVKKAEDTVRKAQKKLKK